MKSYASGPSRKGFTPNPPNSEGSGLFDRGRFHGSVYYPTPAEIQAQADAYQPLPFDQLDPDNPGGLFFDVPDLDSPLSVVLPRKQPSTIPPPQPPSSPLPVVLPRKQPSTIPAPQPPSSSLPVVLPRKEPPSPLPPQSYNSFPPFGPDNPGGIRDYDPTPRPILSDRELVQRALARKPANTTPPSVQAKGGQAAPENFEQKLAQHQGGGKALSPAARDFMEPRFGADFSQVKVHETPELTNAIQAQAFTHGTDIYFNSGKYNPGSSSGKELLAHELTHVVQQSGGQVQAEGSTSPTLDAYSLQKDLVPPVMNPAEIETELQSVQKWLLEYCVSDSNSDL